MREVDRRSKYNRRVFLQGAATAVPTVAVAASAGLGISDAWADNATALTPATLKTLVKGRARYLPHTTFLGDSYYITAIKPWDGKAAKDPDVKSLINDGVSQARCRRPTTVTKVPYAQVPWEPIAWRCCRRIEQTAVLPADPRRPRRLSLQPKGAMARSSATRAPRRAWRLHQTRLRRYRLAPEGLGPGQRTVMEELKWQNSI
jgi:hypothetical protein